MRMSLATGLFFAVFAATAAQADPAAWRVGGDYVVRIDAAEVATPEGVGALLVSIEQSARRLCRSATTRAKRTACEAESVRAAIASAPASAAPALALAAAARRQTHLAAKR